MEHDQKQKSPNSRRDFMRTSAVAGLTLAGAKSSVLQLGVAAREYKSSCPRTSPFRAHIN